MVSSQISDQVLEYNSLTGQFVDVFGDASQEDSGLDFPAGLTVSDQNRTAVYVSSLETGQILRFNGYTGEFLDDPDTPDENEGVVVDLSEDDPLPRLTDLSYGPDGRLYVGFNSASEDPELGVAEVRVYNPETGVLEQSINGLDFVFSVDFGPNGNLYVADNPASLVDPLTGEFLAPDKESRVLVYEIDQVHPLTDPDTGLRLEEPQLISEFNVGVGDAGDVTVTRDIVDLDGDLDTDEVLLYLSNPVSGTVSVYTPTGTLVDTITPSLPAAALMANGGLDADGIPRPTGSIFILETQNL